MRKSTKKSIHYRRKTFRKKGSVNRRIRTRTHSKNRVRSKNRTQKGGLFDWARTKDQKFYENKITKYVDEINKTIKVIEKKQTNSPDVDVTSELEDLEDLLIKIYNNESEMSLKNIDFINIDRILSKLKVRTLQEYKNTTSDSKLKENIDKYINLITEITYNNSTHKPIEKMMNTEKIENKERVQWQKKYRTYIPSQYYQNTSKIDMYIDNDNKLENPD